EGIQRLIPVALHEADAAADRRLAETPQVSLDDGADLWIAARRLSVAHLDDGLATMGHLNDAGHDAGRPRFQRSTRLELVSGQPITVTVALRRNLPGRRPQRIMGSRGEALIFGSWQHPHRGNPIRLASKDEPRRDQSEAGPKPPPRVRYRYRISILK